MNYTKNPINSKPNTVFPTLRVTYYYEVDKETLELIEKALNRANLKADYFDDIPFYEEGIVDKISQDFFIENTKTFDVEFCTEIIESIVGKNFELKLFH